MKKYSINKKRFSLFLLIFIVLIFLILWVALSGSEKDANQTSNHDSKALSSKTSEDIRRFQDFQKERLIYELTKGSSVSPYFVAISTANQRVTFYQNGRVVKRFVCSTGKKETPTPLGFYKVEPERGESFVQDFDGETLECFNWVSFLNHGEYLFHSLPFDRDGNIKEEAVKNLGKADSHGCIRLTVDDSKWVYDNLPTGSYIYIY